MNSVCITPYTILINIAFVTEKHVQKKILVSPSNFSLRHNWLSEWVLFLNSNYFYL